MARVGAFSFLHSVEALYVVELGTAIFHPMIQLLVPCFFQKQNIFEIPYLTSARFHIQSNSE